MGELRNLNGAPAAKCRPHTVVVGDNGEIVGRAGDKSCPVVCGCSDIVPGYDRSESVSQDYLILGSAGNGIPLDGCGAGLR